MAMKGMRPKNKRQIVTRCTYFYSLSPYLAWLCNVNVHDVGTCIKGTIDNDYKLIMFWPGGIEAVEVSLRSQIPLV
jgi:hypothetical protein